MHNNSRKQQNQQWKGSDKGKRTGKKRKRKTGDASEGSTVPAAYEGECAASASDAQWTGAPAYVRGFWDINRIEGDAGLEGLIANNYFLGCTDLEPLPWGAPGSAACQREVECLSEMCRDSDLHARGVAPEVPLRYLELLSTQSPASFSRGSVRNVVLVLNGAQDGRRATALVFAVLSALGPLVLDDVGAYIRDATRPDAARCCAARIVEAACLRSPESTVWRRGGAVIASALTGGCDENSVAVNTTLVSVLSGLRYAEGLPAVKRAAALGRVSPKTAVGFMEQLALHSSSPPGTSSSPPAPTPLPLLSTAGAGGSSAVSLDAVRALERVGSPTALGPDAFGRCAHCGEFVAVCARNLALGGVKAFRAAVGLLGAQRCTEACAQAVSGLAWLPPDAQEEVLAFRAEALVATGRYGEAASDFSEVRRPARPSPTFVLYEAITHAEVQRLEGRLTDALRTLAAVATDKAVAEAGAGAGVGVGMGGAAAALKDYLEHVLAEEKEKEKGGCDVCCGAGANLQLPVCPVVVGDWEHPVVFPVLPLQVQTLGAGHGVLTVSERCFAVISSPHKVEVGQFNDPFMYRARFLSATATTTSSSSSSRPFSPLRSIKSLGVEGCKALAADPGGFAVAAIVRDSQAVTVWELKADYSREIPLGPALRPPERVVCGGHLGGVVAASAQGTITVWHWTEPGDSPARGPFYLAATKGRVTAMAVDNDDGDGPDGRGQPASLFAAVREPKRTCILEYDLRTHTLTRTLLGITGILRGTDPVPIFPLPTVAAVACSSTHVAASTLCGRLHIWERSCCLNNGDELYVPVRHVCCIDSLLEQDGRGNSSSNNSNSNSGGGSSCCGDGMSCSGSSYGNNNNNNNNNISNNSSYCGYGCTSPGCAVSLVFVPGVLFCGLQCGQVVGIDLCRPDAQQPLFRIKGPCLPVTSISPLVQGTELLVRFGHAGCLVSTFLFRLKSRSKCESETCGDGDGDGDDSTLPPLLKCLCCGKVLDPAGPLMKCGGCMKALYCSPGCQAKDWKRHMHDCFRD